MAEPRRPSLEAIRYAAERAVAESSLRPVAKDIGIAWSWLRGFIDGKERDLRDRTKKKLHDWYVRNAARIHETVGADNAEAAATVLAGGLEEPEERERFRNELRDLLTRYYGRYDPPPDWLDELKNSR